MIESVCYTEHCERIWCWERGQGVDLFLNLILVVVTWFYALHLMKLYIILREEASEKCKGRDLEN